MSGAGGNMDAWEPSTLKNLSTNHTVIVSDNRGVGNTTTGTKPFSIQQLANDAAGLLAVSAISTPGSRRLQAILHVFRSCASSSLLSSPGGSVSLANCYF